MTSLFCRHNRFTADCPICSKGTVLDTSRSEARPRSQGGAARRSGGGGARAGAGRGGAGGAFRGAYASAGPYERDGERYEVRLERIPGGVRLAEWGGGALLRRAPVLPAADLPVLLADAAAREVLPEADATMLIAALAPNGRAGAVGGASGDDRFGASPGRAGLMREELRVERIGDEDGVRVARWTFRPNEGWLVHEAPTMFPAERYAEALGAAARRGLLG